MALSRWVSQWSRVYAPQDPSFIDTFIIHAEEKFPLAPFLNLLCFINNRMKYLLCTFTLKAYVCGYLKRPH